MNSVQRLRIVGLLEGCSFLLLLLVGMPLKHLFNMPIATQVLGWAHGALFLAYTLSLIPAALDARWNLWQSARWFVSALIPGGPFMGDRALKHEAALLSRAPATEEM